MAKGDYQTAAKMLGEDHKLARTRDFTCGYTALHWACKHGNLDMVKLLAGTYQVRIQPYTFVKHFTLVNLDVCQASTAVRSHGGYTPLHIAAQSNHQVAEKVFILTTRPQDVFDLLVSAYKADGNVRDYAGKKPRQYMMVQVS